MSKETTVSAQALDEDDAFEVCEVSFLLVCFFFSPVFLANGELLHMFF